MERRTAASALSGNETDEVLRRAREDEDFDRSRSITPKPTQRSVRVADLENPVLRANRKRTDRNVSTFNVILLLFAVAAGIVLYINNIITVNHLAAEVDILRQHQADLSNLQDQLRAGVNQQSGRERIIGIATDRLGLLTPRGKSEWIILDEELAVQLKEAE